MRNKQDVLTQLDFRSYYTSIIGDLGPAGPDGWTENSRCPFHDENNGSFGINMFTGYFKCFGCDAQGSIFDFHMRKHGVNFKTALKRLAEITGVDPNFKSNNIKHYQLGKPVKVYPYTDKNSNVLFNVCRFEPKEFRPCDPDGKFKVKGIEPVPYNLSGFLKSGPVFILEGEKDADTVNNLGSVNDSGLEFIGTCKANWTGKWNQKFVEYFKDRTVCILQDADQAGKDKALDAARELSKDKTIRVKVLPTFSEKQGYDISDWINDGHTKEELLEIADKTKWFQGKSEKEVQVEIKIINGFDLYHKKFKPVKWAIPNLLCEGVSIFAGKPKCGKSILCVNIGISIAAGTKALCSIDVEPGPVLYLALEDVQRRLKTRLQQMLMGDDPTILKNLNLATEWPRMGEGGLKKLDETIQSIPGIRLVIIDTLKMFRPATKGNKSLYDVDYEPIAAIKGIADKYSVSILIIHHLRKSDADDIMDTFSGSLGLTGATDTNLVLERQTGNADATLHVNGRDIEAAEYAMRFQPGNMSWRLLGAAQDVKSTDERQLLYDAFKESKTSLAPSELVGLTGLKLQYIKNTLPKLIKDGSIQKKGRGTYIYNTMSTISTMSTTGTLSTMGTLGDIPSSPDMKVLDTAPTEYFDRVPQKYNNMIELNTKVLEVPKIPIPCNTCGYTDKPKELCCYLAMTGKPGRPTPVKQAVHNCPLKHETVN